MPVLQVPLVHLPLRAALEDECLGWDSAEALEQVRGVEAFRDEVPVFNPEFSRILVPPRFILNERLDRGSCALLRRLVVAVLEARVRATVQE